MTDNAQTAATLRATAKSWNRSAAYRERQGHFGDAEVIREEAAKMLREAAKLEREG